MWPQVCPEEEVVDDDMGVWAISLGSLLMPSGLLMSSTDCTPFILKWIISGLTHSTYDLLGVSENSL